MAKVDLAGVKSLRVICDGSYDAKTQAGAFGVRIVNAGSGKVLHEESGELRGLKSSQEAEAMAIAGSLKIVRGFAGRLVVESDFQPVVQSLQAWSKEPGPPGQAVRKFGFLVDALASWKSRPPTWKLVRSDASADHRAAHVLAIGCMRKLRDRIAAGKDVGGKYSAGNWKKVPSGGGGKVVAGGMGKGAEVWRAHPGEVQRLAGTARAEGRWLYQVVLRTKQLEAHRELHEMAQWVASSTGVSAVEFLILAAWAGREEGRRLAEAKTERMRNGYDESQDFRPGA